MPAIVVSSVNTGTDTLTAVAHGLFTGDRCRVRNVGGALPTGLTATVDVFALRVDVDNVKLCDTNAHALAGIGILDITGAGSGANTVEYGVPYCIPNVVLAPGVQVPSFGLQAAWVALVAIYAVLTGQSQTLWGAAALDATFASHGDRTDSVLGADFKTATGTGVSYTSTTGRALTTTAGTLICRLPLKTGDRIKSVIALLGGDGAVDVTSFVVQLVNASGASSTIGSTTANNLTSSDVPIDVSDTKLAVGDSICVAITANAALLTVDNCRYTYDHPWS